MTDKLKCPFCSEEIFVAHETMCVCKNDKCRAWGCAYPKFILTALIFGKKAEEALIRVGKILLLDSGKPSALTVKGKQEIKRIITSTKQEK